ncbi:hypothetical protein G210_0886 [Candida maltosa Xu316]|uniref:Uncharacterized protein n=1 Tax=Candida maltosa (strain Xu316) TaxID=1245528 RepID=M3K1E4_CANMX|nr:hypothetical protein G210_0886 [Candida maltosa Xu316]
MSEYRFNVSSLK